ncbi:MAG: phosphotransferase [Mariprofundaceae bacterium]
MTREALALKWLSEVLGEHAQITPLAGDASFRRYFRVTHENQQWVLMDAPPEQEDTRPFIEVRAWLSSAGLRVPKLYKQEVHLGFLLLEDFGDISWSSHLANDGDIEPLITDAVQQLARLWQQKSPTTLPRFESVRMHRECDLWLDWYLPYQCNKHPDFDARDAFHQALKMGILEIEALPTVPVHLDFHSRNLMLPEGGVPLGIIDFQDAVCGPVTYDPASLLYDCYQEYPEAHRRKWSRLFFEALPPDIQCEFLDFEVWHRAVRLTAMQRHIKAIGIFTRLACRDGKHQFLKEIPLTKKHLAKVCVPSLRSILRL